MTMWYSKPFAKRRISIHNTLRLSIDTLRAAGSKETQDRHHGLVIASSGLE